MKRLKICLILITIISLLNFTKVFAVEPIATASLNIDKETVKLGDIVTVTLNINCEEGLGYIGTEIQYDENVFTKQSENVTSGWENYGTDRLELMVDTAEKITSGTVYTLVLKVNDNIPDGKTTISTTSIELMDIQNNEYTQEKQEKVVTISKESKTEEESQQTVEPAKSSNAEKSSIKPNNTNNQDSKQTSTKKLPNTGKEMYMIAIMCVLLIIWTTFYIKSRKDKWI